MEKTCDTREEFEFSARCASGFESLLAAELKALGVRRVRPLKGGVAFYADLAHMYKACLWSRTASRILLVLDRFDAQDSDALYAGVSRIPWEQHIGQDKTISVYAHGTNNELRNTQFTAMRTKDAICDRLRRLRGVRPDVDGKNPDISINVSLNRTKATVALNVSGEPLHRRGYRAEAVQTAAPLKETLAASIVLKAGWAEAAQRGSTFIDPMCGSGTLAIEAAMIAADMAPGIMRSSWGFTHWTKHEEALWQDALDEADQRLEAGLEHMPRIVAGDLDPQSIAIAQDNAKRACVLSCIEFHECDARDLAAALQEEGRTLPSSVLMCVNPPYGQRMGQQRELPEVYAALASVVEALPNGCKLAVITPDDSLDSALGIVPSSTDALFNGAIKTALRIYEASSETRLKLLIISLAGVEREVYVAEANSDQFAARFRKVAKERLKWARKNDVHCFRIYDADLSDYSLSVDLYEGSGCFEGERFVRICEYEAPDTVDHERAQRRFNDALKIVPELLDMPHDHVYSKKRRHDKGGGQYRDAQGESSRIFTREGDFEFEIDLGSYLDTGIFLDHRITRSMVGEMAAGKRFLNLFAYTGTATVHAAGGGAASTTTVDMSQTYLDWAKRNMQRNGFRGRQYRYVKDDVTRWVYTEAKSGRRYDLIFCDPPTFSNSKTMGERTWAIQRDHVNLLMALADLLAEGGTIVFSCNLRKFKLDEAALGEAGLSVRDITVQTIPHDFERTMRVHHCYLLEKKEAK